MNDIADLDRRFRCGDAIRVVDRGGHAVVVIATPAASGAVALQGAQVLSWRPAGHDDVLWCGPLPASGSGRPIRGGIPLCWPWFNQHPTDPGKPQHGYARTALWRLDAATLDGGVAEVRLTTTIEAVDVALTARFGATLAVSFTVANPASRAASFMFAEALHTYYRVGAAPEATVVGLDGAAYRDTADGARIKVQSGPLAFGSAMTTAVFEVAPDACTLVDPVLGRTIAISRSGGRSTIAWNPGTTQRVADLAPGAERDFVCVESGNVGASAVTLAPGATHTLALVVRPETTAR